MSEMLLPLALVDPEINHPTKLDTSTAGKVLLSHSVTPSAQSIDKLQGFDTIQKSKLETPVPAPNVHLIVNRLRQNDKLYYHLFHNFTMYANSKVFQAQAMINSSITWNLIL